MNDTVRIRGFSVAGGMCLLVSICLLAYTSLRAYCIPFVHDEGVTYLLFVLPGISSIMDCYSANNHFLNTILMYCSSQLFGNSEIALRLPNLFAHILFMMTAFFFLRSRFSGLALVCTFLILNMNPFVMDFFSLARGYGIAMALMLLCVHFLLCGIRMGGDGKKYILSAFWCAGLAAFANLSFLNLLAGVVGAYLLVDLLRRLRSGNNGSFSIGVRETFEGAGYFFKHIILMLLILVPVGFNFYREKTLYYGGPSGLWDDTVISLVTVSGYNCGYLPVYLAVAKIFILFTAVLLVCMVIRHLKQGLSSDLEEIFLIFMTLSVTAILVVVQNLVFGTPYPMDRTAFHFLLLFEVICILMLEYFLRSERRVIRSASIILLVSLATGTVFHAIRNANLSYSLIWKYTADVKQMLADVESDIRARGIDGKIKFGINWMFEPSLNYYYAVRKPSWLPIVTREGIKGGYDYYYVRPEDREVLMKENVDIMREYPVTGNILARAKAR